MKNIVAACRDAGGVMKVDLGGLREALGYKKLGRYVLEEIDESLREHGLGHFPTHLLDPEHNVEPRQWQEVWIYQRDGSRRARVIDAIIDPANCDVLQVLAELDPESGPDLTDEQKVARVREIVCG